MADTEPACPGAAALFRVRVADGAATRVRSERRGLRAHGAARQLP
jgi:hypothetical protein